MDLCNDLPVSKVGISRYVSRTIGEQDAARGYYHNTYYADRQAWLYDQAFREMSYLCNVIHRDGVLQMDRA